MAETPSKRLREETQVEDSGEESKRYKSYNHILSILEADEDEPNQDLTSLLTTLQQELSLPCPGSETDPDNPTTASTTTLGYSSSSPATSKEDVEEDKERVIRHLLEASDDELGIPHIEDRVVEDGEDEFNNGGDGFSFCDGFWELEDEAANYYTLLQSELFM